jgi:hypothetical protein
VGYVRTRTRTLEFVGAQFEGFEVVADKGTVEDFLNLKELTDRPSASFEAALADLVLAYDRLVPLLVSWNLEDDNGAPIPLDRETFGKQDRELTAAILAAWLRLDVSRPLEQPSPAGEQSVAASIPTEPLSGALPS